MIMSSTFFATLYSALITPLMAQLQAMIGTVCSTMQPIALVMLTIWLAFVGADIALGHKTLPGACKDFAIAAGVIVLLQAGQYTQYITNLFLTAVPTTIGEALGGPTNPASALDTVLNTVINGACDVYKVLPAYALKSIALCGAVIVFVIVALISVAFTYGVYMVAAILNVAAVAVGPVFLALTVIPATRRFSAGWFSVLVGGCATQLMALAVIQLMSGAELTMIRGLLATPPGDANSLVLLWGLAQCGVLLALSTLVVKKIPEVSRAIASGVYHGSAGLQAATFGAAKTIAGGAAAGAARGVGAAVSGATWLAGGEPGEGAAPWRLTRPVGRSLSRGRGEGR
ncbi:MAG TPA: type IV secretion system protein [Stellaceae bacterium]|jgi:type IV secretion system protein VirB6|nr:type IV secretion system protein [Stellaceae bacterium]